MKNSKKNGFTLIEIMIAVGIAGIIAVSSLAPLVFTIKSLEDTQKTWKENATQERLANRIFYEVKNALPLDEYNNFAIKERRSLNKKSSVLYVWSGAEIKSGGQPTLIIYKYAEPSTFDKTDGGIYRWSIKDIRETLKAQDETSTNVADPMKIDDTKLEVKKAKIVMKNATEITFEIPTKNKKWQKEYAGTIPTALKITINTPEKSYEYENRLPNAK